MAILGPNGTPANPGPPGGMLPCYVPLSPLPMAWQVQNPRPGVFVLFFSTPQGVNTFAMNEGDVLRLIEQLQHNLAKDRLEVQSN